MKFDFSDVNESKGYDALNAALKRAVRAVYDFRFAGEENIPQSGGFIIAANHVSFVDPVFIMAVCPRQCHFMAKSDLFDRPVFGRILAGMNAFPVKRGTSDVSALSYAQRVLEKGFVLGIFPEGRRSKDLTPQKGRGGAAYLVKKTGADVLPVSIFLEKKGKIRPKVTVRFGKLIRASEFEFSQQYRPGEIRAAAEKIMDEITALWKAGHAEK